jgi:biotin carboxylase
VLNPPARVAATFRHRIAETLAGIEHLIAPATIRLTADEIAAKGLLAAVRNAGLEPPVIVRPTGSHGGEGLVLAADAESLSQAPREAGADAYVTAFHDYRSPDGYYRKYRMIFVDRATYPYHLAIGPRWMVHHRSADMEGDPARIAEETAFLHDPDAAIGARAMDAIRTIARRLDLDYGGIDFGVTPDGRVLLFAANATMLTHLEPADGPFAAKNAYIQPIVEAFQSHLIRRAAEA